MKKQNDQSANPDNFWLKLKKPVVALSPMDGVTDQPYRFIQKKYGNPDLIYTEFTNVEGVCHGAERLLKDFIYDESQRPIVAQIYGKTPDYFRQVAIILCQLGFDGIDLNMGCPAKTVESSGSGAALIKTPKLAQEIIKATKQGVQEYLAGKRAKECEDISEEIAKEVEKRQNQLPKKFQQPRNIPVSVKTRIGYSKPVVEQWIPTLIEMRPAAIGLHGRTLKQQYSGKADWEEIKKAAGLCKAAGIPILGNGDINTLDDVQEKVDNFDVDGVLIGRASFGNPFVFKKNLENPESQENQKSPQTKKTQPTIYEIALEHCRVYEETFSGDERYNFLPMRKHLGWYVRNIPNAKVVRADLFQTNSSKEVEQVFRKFNLI